MPGDYCMICDQHHFKDCPTPEGPTKYRLAMNEIIHILNWDADHICKCYTTDYPVRNPKCQYHAISELINKTMFRESE